MGTYYKPANIGYFQTSGSVPFSQTWDILLFSFLILLIMSDDDHIFEKKENFIEIIDKNVKGEK